MKQAELSLIIPLIDSDLVEEADAVVLLEGDGYARILHACNLVLQGVAPLLIFSGGVTNVKYGSYPYEMCEEQIKAAGITSEQLLIEKESLHTREQAVNIMELAIKHNWRSIILVASQYHQYRAFLTFLKAMREFGMREKLIIHNCPAKGLPWFVKSDWGLRFSLMQSEFDKIRQYADHVASFEDVIQYYKWKESL